jgi:hypothetical protein
MCCYFGLFCKKKQKLTSNNQLKNRIMRIIQIQNDRINNISIIHVILYPMITLRSWLVGGIREKWPYNGVP